MLQPAAIPVLSGDKRIRACEEIYCVRHLAFRAVLAMLMYFNTFRLLRSGETQSAFTRDDFFTTSHG
ncbi:hypothetical protein UF78_21045 [Stutzerimonas stutzeri]|uniref:Uncharacterized protein n=1 Tax=Stutzerimonas stutzeri TaxID=316 RepID=A0A0D9AJS6_STUST|nr:hypothetical protein UF78_21045 [Stutzerimonas stutzeri]